MEEKEKTEKEQRKLANLKPFKPGQSGNPKGRPKGKRDFKTDFEIAAREIAKALKLGEDPEPIYIELLKQGIKSGLKGNYNFWKDIAERIYGKVEDEIALKGKMDYKDNRLVDLLSQSDAETRKKVIEGLIAILRRRN
jgi:hypothetical protein